jgi:hypothetical protein
MMVLVVVVVVAVTALSPVNSKFDDIGKGLMVRLIFLKLFIKIAEFHWRID